MTEATRGHSYFWALGAILGAMALMLPDHVMPTASRETRLLMVNGGLFVVGVFLGTMDPVGVWRWGVATVLLLPGLELSRINSQEKVMISVSDFLSRMVAVAPNYFLQALPALFGAYVGSFFSKGVGKF